MLHEPVGAAQNGSPEPDEVGHEVTSRPATASGARLPLVGRHRVGGVKQQALSVSQFPEDGIESAHELGRPALCSAGAPQSGTVDVKSEFRLHTWPPPACSKACAS